MPVEQIAQLARPIAVLRERFPAKLNAATTCHAAQTTNAVTFASQYGPNNDAFGKCVSTTATAKSTSQQQATVSAAKFCLAAEKTAGLSSFMTTYGTFGHCVSLKTSGK